MIKKVILSLLLVIGFVGFSNASILSRDILQSAIYETDYSDKFFQIKYDDYNKESYICAGNKISCSSLYDIFQIKYDDYNKESYICAGNKISCSSLYDIFQIKDGYVCPGKNLTCTKSNSIQMPSLIPIESIISIIQGDISSNTCNGSEYDCTDYNDFIQTKKDSKKNTYYICDGSEYDCTDYNDFIQISKDSKKDTYYMCGGSEYDCTDYNDFIQISKDSKKDTYYMCGGSEYDCTDYNDFMQISKDLEKNTYYLCGGSEYGCTDYNDFTQTKRTSSNITENMSAEELDKRLDDLLKDNTNTSSQNQSVAVPSFTMSDVITWMYNMGLTSKSTVADFGLNDYLTREQASKFFVEFAKKVKGTQNINSSKKVSFSDISKADKTLKSYIIEANQMGIINGNKGKFSPFNKLTKAQALAMLMRITDGKFDESYNPRYNQYYLRAKEYGIITDSFGSDLDNENIMRGDVALLFYGMKFRIK